MPVCVRARKGAVVAAPCACVGCDDHCWSETPRLSCDRPPLAACRLRAGLANVNTERFVLAVQSCRHARLCLEDAVRFAQTRKALGKPVIEQQVRRSFAGLCDDCAC